MAEWLKADGAVLSELDALYEAKKKKTEEFFDEKIGGNVFYVSSHSGNDCNDGRSADSAWQHCSKLVDAGLSCGDTVLFECDSIFRERVKLTSGVTYSSYGNGKKPLFYGSIDASGKDAWEKLDEDLYRFKQNIDMHNDIGNVVFDGGKAWGIKIQKCDDADMSLALNKVTNGLEFFEKIESVPFERAEQLPRVDLAYFHSNDGYIYLCSKKGAPQERFSAIELSQSITVFYLYGYTENVTFSNLRVMCAACFGIRTSGCKNITVRNCAFEFIGGAIQFGYECPWRNYRTRYGNGIENWGSCDGMTVERCYFNQIYDAGVTTQTNDADARMERLYYKDNVFNCNQYSFELWGGGEKSVFKDIRITGNIGKNTGDGMSTQRPDKGHESFFNSKGRHVIEDCEVTDNVSVRSVNCMMRSNRFCSEKYTSGYFFDRNVYVHELGKCFALISKEYPEFSGDIVPIDYNEDTVKMMVNDLFEKNGTFYYL